MSSLLFRMATTVTSNGSSSRAAAAAALLGRALRFLRRPPKASPAGVARGDLEALFGMPVGDLALYERALRHRSVLRGQPDSHLLSNERLEFLGDAVLGMIVAERLYDEFPDRDEGFLTRMRAKLVNGQALAAYAEAIDLGPLILMSDNMASTDGRHNATILADAFEAILGALYRDQGIEAARTFVLDLLDERVDLDDLAATRSNYKSLLLEYAQARAWPQPSYLVVHEEGPSHDRRFTVEVHVGENAYGRGTARSKKKAEQKAARVALEYFRQAAEDGAEVTVDAESDA
ncbi:MAG: ribonuclease III [Bacteroidota bacterium]